MLEETLEDTSRATPVVRGEAAAGGAETASRSVRALAS
jgi:hypothetical protein